MTFWHVRPVKSLFLVHLFNINHYFVVGLNTPSAFAARRGYCLRMALRRNGRLIFLDHRENSNGLDIFISFRQHEDASSV